MEKNNKLNSKVLTIILLIAIFGIGLGYAAISRTLTITGTSGIRNNSWDVHFENVSVTTGSVTASIPAAIGTGSTSVNYEISLGVPGEFYEFTVDVKNGGSVPAKLSANPTISGVSTEQDVYINYTVKYADGTEIQANDELDPEEEKTLKVRVEFDRTISADQLPTSNETMQLSFSMDYIQL